MSWPCILNLIQKHPGCKKVAAKNLKKAGMQRTEIKMGCLGWCSVSADEN